MVETYLQREVRVTKTLLDFIETDYPVYERLAVRNKVLSDFYESIAIEVTKQ